MVDKAKRLVKIAELTAQMVPCRSAGSNVTPKSVPPSSLTPSDDILALFAKRVGSQQETMKKMVGLLSSLENQHKQFKHNSPPAEALIRPVLMGE
jgi:predicted nuclease of restriction endonuclease-like RecB superfamily